MHPCLGSIFNVFQNKVSRRSTTAINTYKNLFDQHFAFLKLLFLEFGQRKVTFYLQKLSNIVSLERGEKKSQTL